MLIADRLAGELDRSKGPELTKAVAEFQRALALLPLDAPAPLNGGSGDGGDGGRGRVLELLDRPAAVGDSSHTG